MITAKASEVIAQLKAGGKVPANALRCTATSDVENLEGVPSDAKSIKVHLKARTRDAINHWFFGETYHDFSTAKLPEKVALDDSHGNEIGYARPSLTDYGLELSGVVVTMPENPAHESNRIAYNLRNAIPQQASIDFSGDYGLRFVEPKAKFTVNGSEKVAGETGAIVIENWSLRACAICKEGADPTTETTTFTSGDFAPSPISITTFADGKDMRTCSDCGDSFDATGLPEVSMGAVACPKCGKAVSQQTISAEPQGVEAKPTKPTEPVVPVLTPPPVVTEPETVRDVLAELTVVRSELESTKTQLAETVQARTKLESEIAELNQRLTALSKGVPAVPVAGAELSAAELMAQFVAINKANPIKGREFWLKHETKLQDPRWVLEKKLSR